MPKKVYLLKTKPINRPRAHCIRWSKWKIKNQSFLFFMSLSVIKCLYRAFSICFQDNFLFCMHISLNTLTRSILLNMAANLNKIADKVKDNSKENQHTSRKQKELKMKSKGTLAHRPTGRPPFMAWAEQESENDKHFAQRAEVIIHKVYIQ